ncbi:DUF1266 domain-containing protein [Endozoicomonas sp. SM1973]|uniref:DUF1266 domain-containing protein n=1 Tax=Spartinivicinus marinus TaxID=2994442 RepID=A0A853I533_9GAMM|nr:DUF1266 domain-containing protein [Spartinivicinus marinus]MCX4026034.1 DUF1266 domain-containing protein [Spartinivicinus marinus]NYZ69010.1 DUF1266 domain-containing protein [Spartinivicinus marinus]
MSIHFLKKMIKIVTHKKYQKNPTASNLFQEQILALNIGAINSEQVMYYCDSLDTGADLTEVRQNLADYYSIVDRESALEVLSWLKERGHSVYFDAIKKFVAGESSTIQDFLLEESEKKRAYTYIHSLQDTLEFLVENNFIEQASDLGRKSIIAWDLGRLVLVSRCCYECGYLNEEEAWENIMFSAERCRKDYSDWEEFAVGYIIGRSMWCGNSMTLRGIVSIIKDLLIDQDSPWLKYKF